MVLMIDNYDSFTYNLVQYFRELGETVEVYRNDKISVDEIRTIAPDQIVISPGPCTPYEAGISIEVIEKLGGEFPILGVCLGHQSIGAACGGKVIRAKSLMHGKTSMVTHDGSALFRGVSNPFIATRYHSLVIERETIPAELKITAWTDDGEIMAVEHATKPIWGIQYHPESILTVEGKKMLQNFLDASREGNA